MAILNNSNAISTGGYDINNSLRFRASASAYLSRTPASAGNRQKFTFSYWIKRGTLSAAQEMYFTNAGGGTFAQFSLAAGNTITFASVTSSTSDIDVATSAVFRDPSAWYHVMLVVDTTQATSTNRVLIYVNGVSQTISGTYPAQNYNCQLNTTTAQNIGRPSTGTFDGYIAEYNFIDGQALTPSSFGSTNATTGVWQPAKYTGTYGTNGFYLKFSNIALTSGSNTGLGQDFSGNGNYWNTNNISVTSGTTYDAMTDVPTLTSATVANYAVMNPLTNQGGLTVSNANLNVSVGNGSSWKSVIGTMALPSTGQWYWEVTVVTGTGSTQEIVGVANTVDNISSSYSGSTANTYGYQSNGSKNNNAAGVAYGASYTTGDVIGVAVDTGAGTITFYKNNVSQGTAFTGLSSSYSYVAASSILGTTSNFATNFGQRPFSYTPPTGYVALNAYNLPTSTIVQGNKYMDATTYTGTAAAQSIVNAGGFKPDFVWLKERSIAQSHYLYDSVRGATKYLQSDTTGSESTVANALTSFNSNGFSIGSFVGANDTGATEIAWQWQAGQGSTSSNTSGSITSTVSVNTTAGFSVVTWTNNNTANQSVGHGLGVAPKMIITKDRDNGTFNWAVWFTGFTKDEYLLLNTTGAKASYNTLWYSVPDSSKFYIGSTGTGLNNGTDKMVAYCWASIPGFSAFGSYTGNGSADGSFIYTGFQPAFILIKVSSTVDEWVIFDNKRPAYNATNLRLNPNSSGAEQSTQPIDILSNGFKLRGTGANINGSGNTYIYAAFASNPFKNSNAF